MRRKYFLLRSSAGRWATYSSTGRRAIEEIMLRRFLYWASWNAIKIHVKIEEDLG